MHSALEVFCVPTVQNLWCFGVDQSTPFLGAEFRIEVFLLDEAGGLLEDLLFLSLVNDHAHYSEKLICFEPSPIMVKPAQKNGNESSPNCSMRSSLAFCKAVPLSMPFA